MKDELGVDILDNQAELEKVFIIPSASSGTYVRCGGIIPEDSFVRVAPIGYVEAFDGCPVHSPERDKIVGRVRFNGGGFGDVIQINMDFNIKNSDCLCEVDDIEV